MKNSKFDKLFNTIMEEAKPSKKHIIKEDTADDYYQSLTVGELKKALSDMDLEQKVNLNFNSYEDDIKVVGISKEVLEYEDWDGEEYPSSTKTALNIKFRTGKSGSLITVEKLLKACEKFNDSDIVIGTNEEGYQYPMQEPFVLDASTCFNE